MSPRLTAGALITVLGIRGWEPGCPRTGEAVTVRWSWPVWDTERAEGRVGAGTRLVLVLAGQLLRTPAFPGLPPATSPAPGQGGEDSGHTSTDTDDGNSQLFHIAWMGAWTEHSLHRY